VNSYGRDLPPKTRIAFSELLARVDAIDGIERIRYTSPHPKDIREDVIRAHAELPALCEHIHLPLQSGSSRVLKAMRRTYNRERYMARVAEIREQVPDCALTTDIIVGFPGETEEDFSQTLEVVEEVGYDSAFTSSSRRAAAPRRRRSVSRSASGQARAHGAAGGAGAAPRHERGQRFVGRAVEVLSKARAEQTQRGCGAEAATTRRSISTGPRRRASSSTSRFRGPRQPPCLGSNR